MTNEEILVSFKQSAKPLQQVRILADLNGTDQETIRQILENQGVDPTVLRRKPKVQKKKYTAARAFHSGSAGGRRGVFAQPYAEYSGFDSYAPKGVGIYIRQAGGCAKGQVRPGRGVSGGWSMRPIDADALLQRWNNLLPHMARDKDGKVPVDFCLVICDASATPTLTLDDLRPRGRWIAQDETLTKFMCSVCESKNYGGYEKFCPNCGADMRGGANG